MKVQLKKVRENAILPSFGSTDAAGADLCACVEQEIQIPGGETAMVPTGLAMAIPKGYVGLIFARSGLASKRGLAPANKVGVIDADYRGEIFVALHNHQASTAEIIKPGDRIAQIVILPYPEIEYEETEQLPETERGEGGFGSTGLNTAKGN